MADHASTTTALPARRVPTDPAPARVLTSPLPGDILLGSDDTGPVLRIPTTTTRDELRAVLAALGDLLARLEPALDAAADALAPAPSYRFDNVLQGHIIPTGDQQRGDFGQAVMG